ncbi:hypothetical protein GCM10007973_25040 [Polymorphobacter multimanifer]|uniref:BLUF domain-containing protein n=1 Tax=Polymorphobacter multimanifer TaxID=1070431 RepID=A0A841LD34_9SPHN|nr:BLUF domain-containing protein [Polymorphobacter multimanifer]MBB6226888.1 hypothetical protein [Polymorphobacter multimanifer]GGI87561.1 hypothetical protein GCM10007973_25040 [Polymorphobacter multimanifer]
MFDEFGFPGDVHLLEAAPILATFVYCSRAAEGVDDAAVDHIIEWSQRRNTSRDITGVLVFGSGVFFQWIEGPPVQVEKLIASLHGDSRHHDVVALDRSVEKRDRLYPDWQMERVGAEDIRTVLQDALESSEDKSSIAALQRILQHLDSGSLATIGRV